MNESNRVFISEHSSLLVTIKHCKLQNCKNKKYTYTFISYLVSGFHRQECSILLLKCPSLSEPFTHTTI